MSGATEVARKWVITMWQRRRAGAVKSNTCDFLDSEYKYEYEDE